MILRRRRRPDPDAVGHTLADDLPKKGLFEEPVRVARIQVEDPKEVSADEVRVSFRVMLRDAADRRCSNVAIEARIAGPHRTATGTAVTDLTGHARFRMTGPAGRYELEILDVAAGGLEWDRDAGPTTADLEV